MAPHGSLRTSKGRVVHVLRETGCVVAGETIVATRPGMKRPHSKPE